MLSLVQTKHQRQPTKENICKTQKPFRGTHKTRQDAHMCTLMPWKTAMDF